MEFKSHPYYDDSDARDWLSLRPEDWTELEPGPERELQDRLRADKPWLCGLALDRIRAAMSDRERSERPYADVTEFLFFPLGTQGYRVYIQYFFSQRPNEASPDSDFWWAIINSPGPAPSSARGLRDGRVIGVGWLVP